MKTPMLRDFSTHYVSTACLLMSNTNTLDKRWHPVPGLLHVGIDFARYCTNVRPAFLRNGGQKMLSVVNILVYRWLEYQHPIMVCISARNWSSMTNVPWLFRRSLQSIALLLVTFENQKMTQPKKKKRFDWITLQKPPLRPVSLQMVQMGSQLAWKKTTAGFL